ncbi:MAG TPA: toprim domain-containing protein, partial [Gemmatimonadales bacterium]|nr:toprim domain-containing protein [Gemmatimonadales bacterium]
MATRAKRTVKAAPEKPAAKKSAKAPKSAKAAKAPKASAPANGRNGRGGSALVIVESPTKAKTIGKYLGAGFDVKATVGHLRDLPTRELGVDVDRGFEPKYVTIKGKTKTLAELKKAAKSAKEIYLATDPDREGEAIAWHVADQLAAKVPTHRVLFEEITRDAVLEAMRSPGNIDERKVNAQQARRILDRLVGYGLSPLLWKKIAFGLSAGRVQSVAVDVLVRRERERMRFRKSV